MAQNGYDYRKRMRTSLARIATFFEYHKGNRMKIVFANPPVITQSIISEKMVFTGELRVCIPQHVTKYRDLMRTLRAIGIDRGIRYGVRAGSRWPWTTDAPVGALHYPFIMGYAASNARQMCRL